MRLKNSDGSSQRISIRRCWCSANPKRGPKPGGFRERANLFFYNMEFLNTCAGRRQRTGGLRRFAHVTLGKFVNQDVMRSLYRPQINAGVD